MKKLLTLVACAVLVMPLSAQTWSKALEKSAKAGDVEAQFTVGNAYLTGDGVKQNLKKATQWLFMAAQAGQADAIKALCTYYSDALEQVAAAGNADAQFALANFYETGNGVAQNQAKALELYGSAAAQGIAEAKPKVLGSYNAGIVILADAGDIDAQFALANFYETGNGVAQNNETALSFYGDAAAQGHQEAKAKVLGSYNPGIVKLAKAGDLDAATQVADFLFNGKGGATKNEADAATYYSIAYKAGNKSAGTKLITMYNAYLSGRGVPKNEDLGYLYLAKAAAAGIEEAKEKFYLIDTPYLVNSAKNGDFEAKKALAKFRGGWFYLDAIDACKNTDQCLELYEQYDPDKMAVVYTDSVLPNYRLYEQDALVNWVFYLPHEMVESKNFYFSNVDVRNVKIYSPNVAYFLIWKNYGSVTQRHILVKRLMNEFNHELAKKAYDEHYFQYDYEPYDIVNFDIPSGFEAHRATIKGFTGLDNVAKVCYEIYSSGNFVEINSEKHECEVPTSEELQMLIESVPDFAINQDAVRVIRGLTIGKDEDYRWIVDAFYLPGLIAYGPDSYVEIFDMGSKPGKLRFGSFATEDTRLELNGTTTGVETYTDKDIREFNAKIESITTTIRERTLQFEDWKIFTHNTGGKYRTDKYFAVVDGDTVGMSADDYEDLFLEHYTVKGQDGIEYSLMPEEYTRSIDKNLPYELCRRRWYRMTYPKPDGKKMDVLIPAWFVGKNTDKMTFDNIKENLNAAFLDSIFNEADDAVVIAENGEMIPYKKGILASEYDAQEEQRKEAEDNAKWEAFWEDMAKQYGKSQANMFRNSDDIVMKGLDIRLLIKYTVFMYEEWNRNVGAVKFYRTDADGYGIFILYKLSGAEIWIRTKNNKIYDWTLYSND